MGGGHAVGSVWKRACSVQEATRCPYLEDGTILLPGEQGTDAFPDRVWRSFLEGSR